MLKSILFPTKFEEFSLDILKSIVCLKELGVEEVFLLHVIDTDSLYTEVDGGGIPIAVDLIRKAATEHLTSYAQHLQSQGLMTKVRIVMGRLVPEILKTAEQTNASLIVAGRQKRDILGELFVGSTTNRIIRKAKVPVLVVKYHVLKEIKGEIYEHFCIDMFRKVLFATDWSLHAERAKEYVSMLRRLRATDLVVVHALEELLPEVSLRVLEEFQRSLRKENEAKLEALKCEFEAEGFHVQTILARAPAYQAINRIATEENVSIIVMGTHGRGFVEGILYGSVCQRVVEYSEKPVLVVK